MVNYVIIDGDLGGMWKKSDGGTLHGGSRMKSLLLFEIVSI